MSHFGGSLVVNCCGRFKQVQGNPFGNQVSHANIKPDSQCQCHFRFQPLFKTTLPRLLQECVSTKIHSITYPGRFDSFT